MPPVDPARVLVVDDDPEICELTSTLLGGAYTVTSFTDPMEARAFLEREEVELVLADQMMPGLSGVELLAWVLSNRPSAARVLATASSRVEDLRDAVNVARVHAFLSKPARARELRAAVERALSMAAPLETGPDGTEPVTERLRRLVDEVHSGQVALPEPPTVALELRALHDDRWPRDAVIAALERDPEVAAAVRSLPQAAAGTPLDRVVGTLGPEVVMQAAEVAVARRCHRVRAAAASAVADSVWTHAWARATAMALLAANRPQGEISARDAHLAGLFADVGAPFLLDHATELGASENERERFVLRSHEAVGGAITLAWRLPPECTVVAQAHHQPGVLSLAQPMLILACAADQLCESLGYASYLGTSPGGRAALAAWGVGVLDRETLRERVVRRLTAWQALAA